MAGAYESLLRRATADRRIVGVILSGSRGKGFETQRSDWDVHLVTADDVDPTEVRVDYDDPSGGESA